MRYPLISIIIPTLNQETYIRKTLESIARQEYPNIEVIVMDGGSHDQTIEIVRLFDQKSRLRQGYGGQVKIKNQKSKVHFFWMSEKDRGQADAVNKGLRMAKGEIVAYLNSDDYYEPHAIQKVGNYFALHPETWWLTGDCRIVNEKEKEIQQPIRWYKKILRMLPLRMVLPVLNPLAQPSTFWRRRIGEDIGFFDETLRYAFDYDYWIRISRKHKLTVIPHVLSSFRIHEASKGTVSYVRQFSEELSVSKKYVKNPITLFLHAIHNKLIVGVYNVIKQYA